MKITTSIPEKVLQIEGAARVVQATNDGRELRVYLSFAEQVYGGDLLSFHEASKSIYTLQIQAADKLVSVQVAEKTAQDVAGNLNLTSDRLQVRHYNLHRAFFYSTMIQKRVHEHVDISHVDSLDETLLGNSDYEHSSSEVYDPKSQDSWDDDRKKEELHWSFLFSSLIAQWAQ